MLAISISIGIYFGYIGKKKRTTDEYLLGSKSMKTIPVALSLIASNISAVTLLSIPTDVYLHGSNIFFHIFALPVSCVLIVTLYLPVILKLEVPNGFEYLRLRFNKHVRTFASAIVVLQILLINSIMAYIPSIALSQGLEVTISNKISDSIFAVTGLNVHLISGVVCIVCIFYTTIGGFRAVIWTDTFQLGVMVISIATVLYFGTTSVGGLNMIWAKAQEGERLNFDIDPTIKDGFWPIVLGSSIIWTSLGGIHPASMQKYLSISDRKYAKWCCVLHSIGVVAFVELSVLIGLMLHAKYRECDPVFSKQIKHGDQLLPFFVASAADNISGVFMMGLFSASLSSLSSSFNTLGATIYGDFVKPHIPTDLSRTWENYILKFIVVAAGMLCIALTFLIDQLGSIFTFLSATQGCVSGLLVGLFSLGMLFPSANSKGALCGTLASCIITFWIAGCHEWYKLKGAFNHFVKPLSIDNCTVQFNVTPFSTAVPVDEPFYLYRLSYWYNSFIGLTVLITVGMMVSCCTKPDDQKVDVELISPILHYLNKKIKDRKNIYKPGLENEDLQMTTHNFNKMNN
ncbi:hypothetical protein FQR65_LT04693 [Abscondita terminalis]|nr:hypothetical protein FQR65_LT04693 [Abscondita terminalis]